MRDGNPGRFNPVDAPTASAAGTSQPRTVLVEKCVVITVYPEKYTLDARSELTHRFHTDVSFMVPYCHQEGGEGISFMPEVGSTCWVCRSSEQNRYPFVLGWTMVDEGGSYKGGREDLNPGDIKLSTRDGNFIYVRRGGIIQIGSTPVCQRVYIPIRNIIQDFAENYELHTPAGDLTWTVLRPEQDGDGHQRCEYVLAAKEYADDPNDNPVALLKIGSHGEGSNTILTLQTRSSGGGQVKFSLDVGKSGEVNWKCQKLTMTILEELNANVTGNVNLKTLANMMLQAAQITVTASNISLTAGGMSLVLGSGGGSMAGGQIRLNSPNAAPVVIDDGTLRTWFLAIKAALAAHSPPIVIPDPPTYTSGKVLA
jgi:hypothetical protein